MERRGCRASRRTASSADAAGQLDGRHFVLRRCEEQPRRLWLFQRVFHGGRHRDPFSQRWQLEATLNLRQTFQRCREALQLEAGEEAAQDRVPVSVQQQHAATDGGAGGPPLPLVHAQLHGALRPAETPQALPPSISLHIRGECPKFAC